MGFGSDGRPIPEHEDERAIQTLNKITEISFSATPSFIRPFDPKPAVLNWRVRLPNDPDASGIKFTIDGIDEPTVPAAGSRPVRPPQTTTFRLFAHLRKEKRPLAGVTVSLDMSTCTDADTMALITESSVHNTVEDQITQFLPPEYQQRLRKTARVAAEPQSTSFHIHVELTLPNAYTIPYLSFDVDATVKVDMRITFSLYRGLLNVDVPWPDVDVEIDLSGPDALYKLSPAVQAFIDEWRQRVLILLTSGAVEGGFREFIGKLFRGALGGAEYRYWSMGMTKDNPDDNSRDNFLQLIACNYPRPWTARLSFVSLSVTDDLANMRTPDDSGNIAAKVWFDLQAASTWGTPIGGTGAHWRLPQVGELVVPLDATGHSGVISLARVGGSSFDLGMLDELSIVVIGHDVDRDAVECVPPAPGEPGPVQKPGATCRTPPARYMARSYDLGERFGNGIHIERSVVASGESFEVVFRVDLVCPECAAEPSPSI